MLDLPATGSYLTRSIMIPTSVSVKAEFKKEGTISSVLDIMASYLQLGILVNAQYAVDPVEGIYAGVFDRSGCSGGATWAKSIL